MKLSLLSFVMLTVGFAAAAPSPSPKGPPGPPGGTVGAASESCGNSISLSSLHCCTQSGSGNSGNSKGHGDPKHDHKIVKDGASAYDMQCSAIAADGSNAVSDVCSVTVACCYGAGCIAIAN